MRSQDNNILNSLFNAYERVGSIVWTVLTTCFCICLVGCFACMIVVLTWEHFFQKTNNIYDQFGLLLERREYYRSTGELHGRRFMYDSYGTLLSISTYRKNQQEGRECSYYRNGQLHTVRYVTRELSADPAKEAKIQFKYGKIWNYDPKKNQDLWIPLFIRQYFRCGWLEEALSDGARRWDEGP